MRFPGAGMKAGTLCRRMAVMVALAMGGAVLSMAAWGAGAGGPEDDADAADILDGPVNEKAVVEQFRKAAAEAARQRQEAPLMEALELLCRHRDVVIPAETMETFTDAVLSRGKREAIVPFVGRFLKFKDAEALPPAVARLNLGIKLALVYGGASVGELQDLLTARKGDVQWLLPAIAKAGGAAVLPLIREYRNDKVIIPLGNEQNIREVPCAAILAAAYAGDEEAREKILQFYDEDVENLPRFAFYVSWGLQEGMSVVGSKQLLAFCQHRIRQAERLFDFLGPAYLPKLMKRANDTGSPALTGFLVRKLQQAPRERVRDYMGLLDNPTPTVRQRVVDRVRESGDAAAIAEIAAKLRGQLGSARGTDRFFAVETLMALDPENGRKILEEGLSKETNVAVRIRLEDLSVR